ncbi:hypothetical protein JVU11DRAFT_11391 [Chiua virens]|nr:hypothetical protein JVU11DRAFT_11391 [Chiua virens]
MRHQGIQTNKAMFLIHVFQHIGQLEELRELHKAKSSEEDRWHAYSYGKCE